MRIGYARVSTIEQHEERQLVELQEKADVERTFLDKLSGKNTERPELQKMIDFAREGAFSLPENGRLGKGNPNFAVAFWCFLL